MPAKGSMFDVARGPGYASDGCYCIFLKLRVTKIYQQSQKKLFLTVKMLFNISIKDILVPTTGFSEEESEIFFNGSGEGLIWQ